MARAGQPIDKARPLRTSSASVTLWRASATTSFAASDRTDSDVAEALALGFDVVRRDAIGETTRAELGDRVFVLQMRHAPRGRGKKQLGVVLHVGSTFFVYLLASARASNLEADTTDRRGNAATELLAMVVREMASVGREHDAGYRPHVYAREHARIVRDEQHGADLKATFVSCRVIAHTPHLSDLTKPADAQHFSFGSMLSAASADANIMGMSRADIVIQANGGFNEDIRKVPFTHGPLVRREVDHRTGVPIVTFDKHRIACVEDTDLARRHLRLLVDKILEDRYDGKRCETATDWLAVGDLMADLGLPCRLPAYLTNNISLKELPAHTREAAAKSLFNPRWVSGWRDGSFEQLVPAKISMDLDLSDFGVESVFTPDGKHRFRCRVDMPIPEGGWGVSDDEWDEVLRRRNPLKDKPRVYTGMVMPLAGMSEWDDEEAGRAKRQFRIVTATSRYLLASRPIQESRNLDGSRRGWDGCTVDRHGVARASDLHKDVARALREALLHLDGSPEPVLLTGAPNHGGALGGVTTTQSTALRKAELEKQLARAQQQRRGAVDARNEAKGRHADENCDDSAEDLQDAEDDLVRAQGHVKQLRTELKALDASAEEHPRRSSLVEVGVQTATAEFVAAALEKCEGGAPGWLQEACQVLFTQVRMASRASPGEAPKLRWTATLRLQTVDTAGNRQMVALPLTGEVRDRTKARNGSPIPHGPEAWAWAYFYRGHDLATIGKEAGVDGSGKKHSYLYKGLCEWLTSATAVVPDPRLRTAALDCPIPSTRRVLWTAVTGDTSALSGIDEKFAKYVLETYGGHSSGLHWGWCKDTHQLARRVAQLLVENGGSAPLFDLAQQLNVSPHKLTALARVTGKSTKQGAAARPAREAVSPFTKNWGRGGRCLPPEERRLSLRSCPHRDCPERLRGGEPHASHVLLVPETEAGFGVLCPHCSRLPVKSMASVRFPADYLRPWSGRFGQGSHAGARHHSGSHLDPNLPDPGPAQPLPDTGTLPRAETAVSKPGNYMARQLRARPMLGRRILPLALTPEDNETISTEANRLGGRIAVKVTKGLQYVVVTDRAALMDPRARRAVEQGAEVMTVSEFRARALDGWPRGHGEGGTGGSVG